MAGSVRQKVKKNSNTDFCLFDQMFLFVLIQSKNDNLFCFLNKNFNNISYSSFRDACSHMLDLDKTCIE